MNCKYKYYLKLFIIFFIFTNNAKTKEYSDIICGVKYEIPKDIITHEQYVNKNGIPGYMLSATYTSPDFVVVYSSLMRRDDDRASISNALEDFHTVGIDRPNQIITKRYWGEVGGKKYHICESYYNEKSKTYLVDYAYGWKNYVFCIMFVTKQPQDNLTKTHEHFVAQVRYPE